MKYTEIDHPSHPHTLEIKSVEEPYFCNGCTQLGFLPCYQCPYPSCKFHLHEECARPPSTAIHPFFKKPIFTFPFFKPCTFTFRENSFARICDGCGKDILGYSYQCSDRNLDLHPCCVKLPFKINRDGVELRLTDKVSTRCLRCKNKHVTKKVNGWSYVSNSTSSENEYCFHVACVKDMVVENWSKGHFGHGRNNNSNSQLALQSMVPSQDQIMVLSNNNGGESRAKKYWRMARIVFKLIFSAIFGDPISGSVAVVEALSIKWS